MGKVICYNDLYVVTTSVLFNFIEKENALVKIGTWDFESCIGVNVVNQVHCNEVDCLSFMEIENYVRTPKYTSL